MKKTAKDTGMKSTALAILAGALGTNFVTTQVESATPNVVVVQCVQTAGTCVNGINNTPSNQYDTMMAQGYHKPGDGGGGRFADIGACDNVAGGYSVGAAGFNLGDTIIPVNTISGVAIGSIIQSASGSKFQPGTQIVAIRGPNSVVVSIPAIGNAGSGLGLNLTPNNGGTLLTNSVSHCLTKTDYRGDPHEWGAYGDGTSDDSSPLKSWLAGPGPWDATIPAIYLTGSSLTCWPNIHIRAIANDGHAGAYKPMPPVTIKATGALAAGTGSRVPVIMAENYCHITGLAVDASNTSSTNSLVDAVDLDSMNNSSGVVIDGHALLENGNNNLYCNTGGGSAGTQVKDSQFGPSWGDNINFGACANDRFIGNIITQAGFNSPAGTVWPIGHPAGLYFSGDEMTLSNGVVEESLGAGVMLDTATHVSITSMNIG